MVNRRWAGAVVAIGAATVAVATVGSRIGPSPSPASVSTQRMGVVAGSYRPGLAFVPPDGGPCRSADLTARVLADSGPSTTDVATVRIDATRTCGLGGRETVTPLQPDRRPAAPAVVLDGTADGGHVVVGPGHPARLSIRWFFDPCEVSSSTPPSLVADRFAYEFRTAAGTFALSERVEACPMAADLESDDTVVGYPITAFGIAAPATVDGGKRFVAHAELTYESTARAVFDGCPAFWSRLSAQSVAPVTSFWQLACDGMAPLQLGDRVEFDVPFVAPSGIPAQAVVVTVGFGLLPDPVPELTGLPLQRTVDAAQLWLRAPGPPLQPVVGGTLPPPVIPVPIRRTTRPPCRANDLRATNLDPRAVGAVGSHGVAFTLVNATPTACTLFADAPIRLTAPAVPALAVPTSGGPGPPSVDGELEPGASTDVEFWQPNWCGPIPARTLHYRTVVIELPDGDLTVPFPIDEQCGVSTGGAGIPGGDELVGGDDVGASIHAPAKLQRGVTAIIEVTLSGSADWSRGCPGYAVTIAGVETRRGLPCPIRYLLPDVPATYEITVDVPPTAPVGPSSLRFELLTRSVPSDEAVVTLA